METRMEKELLIAFRAGDGRIDHRSHFPTLLPYALRYAIDGKLMRRWIADDSAFANVLAARLKLRFHQNDGFSNRWRGGKNRRQHERDGDEGHIDNEERRLRLCCK